jgi:two-component system nitrogen regulation sensor histidine kinase NtrY
MFAQIFRLNPSPNIARITAFLLGFGVLACSVATFIYLNTDGLQIVNEAPDFLKILSVNLILLVALVVVIGIRVFVLWRQIRQGLSGTKLQRKIIVTFGLVALVPTVMVTIFSAAFFNFGIKAWFDDKVSKALSNSLEVAEAYLEEHKGVLRADAQAMASDLSREAYMSLVNPGLFNGLVSGQAALRSLSEAVVIQSGRIIGRSDLSFTVGFERLPLDAIETANAGEVAIITSGEDGRVRAVIKLPALDDTYLLVGRLVDPKVLGYMDTTEGAVNEYKTLKKQISKLQARFMAVYVFVALALILTAMWYGMALAAGIVRPIAELMNAAERVGSGDYSAIVKVSDAGDGDDEISRLADAFNRMTAELSRQRQEVIETNRLLDQRRIFIEEVLEGISAGVLALDEKKKITLANRQALEILGLSSSKDINGKALSEIRKELVEEVGKSSPGKPHHAELPIQVDGATKIIHMRAAVDLSRKEKRGFTLTFDDVTNLVQAQRSAAWADVARRIAHEIKNPLTPIQLSAERLRKKYAPQDEAEKEAFGRYVETIVRHVGDIGKMVDEFVSFARMPAPELRSESLNDILRKAIFSEQVAKPIVKFTNVSEISDNEAKIMCDGRMITQAIGNLLKNASESLEETKVEHPEVVVSVIRKDSEHICISIADNGAGFPEEELPRLTEPYITTKSKGTGLGLAIVKRIVEEHGGSLILRNRLKQQGAVAEIILPG